ncbi:MAG: ABC transporter permease [Acholeplasmataceae bacterium]|jgi:ABC-2 type transport system permease protein
MKNLFILNFKKLIKNKVLIFWALVFPIALSFIFHLVFQSIKNSDFFETITVNYIKESFPEDGIDKQYLIDDLLTNAEYEKNLTHEETLLVPIFNMVPKTLDEAKEEFKKDGTIYLDKVNNQFVIRSKTIDLDTTLLESIINDYNNAADVSLLLMEESNYTITFEQALNKHMEGYNNVYLRQSGNKKLDYINNHYYTVVALAIIYGAFIAFEQAKIYRFNTYAFAKRVKVSGVSRPKLLFSSILSSLLIQFIIVAIYLVTLIFFFDVTFGNIWLALLAVFLGIISMNITGFFFGIFFNTLSENAVIAIIILVGTLGGFFAGMMVGAIKFFINVYAKPLAYLNVNGLISDSFVQLDFGNLTNYWYDMLALIGISLVLLGLTFYKYVKKEK